MWFITVFEKIDPSEEYLALFGDQRTWGYYKEREMAVQALHENWTDMQETLYSYALIEKIEEGISATANERQWFKWDVARQGFFEIEEPECVEHIVNFAIV